MEDMLIWPHVKKKLILDFVLELLEIYPFCSREKTIFRDDVLEVLEGLMKLLFRIRNQNALQMRYPLYSTYWIYLFTMMKMLYLLIVLTLTFQ